MGIVDTKSSFGKLALARASSHVKDSARWAVLRSIPERTRAILLKLVADTETAIGRKLTSSEFAEKWKVARQIVDLEDWDSDGGSGPDGAA